VPSLLRIRALFCLIGFGESAFVPFLPLLLRDRGLSSPAIGAVIALYAAVGFAAGPVWGYLADRRIGRERTLALCLAGTVVGSILLGLAHGPAALAVAGSIAWLFRAPALPLADALALDRLGNERRDEYGTVRLWMSATFAVGAVVFGAIIEAVGIGLMAFAYAVLAATNALLVALVFRGRWPRPRLRHASTLPVRSLATAPAVLLFLTALFLLFAPYYAGYNFVSVRIAALGGGAIFVGLAGALQAAAEVPSMLVASRFAHRLRPAHVFGAGAAFFVLAYALWSVVDNAAVVAGIRIFAGFGFGLTTVGSVVIADELVPQALRATGQAASKAVSAGLGPVAGSLAGGFVFGDLGPATFFAGAGILTAASAAVAWVAEQTQLEQARPVEAVDT
jgi:MFS transporter, PPP family, 3-phenylpropionic acid transporter